MYTGTTKSALINSYIWDITLNWIISSGAKTQAEVVTDSKTWGNYYDAAFTVDDNAKYSANFRTYLNDSKNKSVKISWLLTTGATTRNSANNIYDMAGNLFEWTTEVNGFNGITMRSGDCRDYGYITASYRRVELPSYIDNHIGFRPVLYW